jgi:hypothetical protein
MIRKLELGLGASVYKTVKDVTNVVGVKRCSPP